MLINALKMLIMAGKDALGTTGGLPVIDEDITQISHGLLTFPSFGEVGFKGGNLNRVHLGCDTMLSGRLAKSTSNSGPISGLEIFAKRFVDNAVAEMSGRHPRGWIESLKVEQLNLHSRGVRSFGFRLQTDLGTVFLMAEVPSHLELEMIRDEGYLPGMVGTYLPKGWAAMKNINSTGAIDSFMIFLRKTEIDVQVEVSAGDDQFTIHHGVLLKTTKVAGQRVFRLCMDISDSEGKVPGHGDEVRIKVGVQDRAITFISKYLGQEELPIVGSATVKCVDLSLPKAMKVEQRRRTFRIPAQERIPVEIECFDQDQERSAWSFDEPEGYLVKGQLADLSFSGARIIADLDQMNGTVTSNSKVLCRLFFPGEPESLQIKGIIRRATTRLADWDNQEDEVGLEFLADEDGDRQTLEFIRQYVLSQQRSWLSQRIHVAGVEQW